MSIERVFLIVLDSVGIGEMPDADLYGDKGSNTVKACFSTGKLDVPFMKKLGLFNIEGNGYGGICQKPIGPYGRFAESSKGKDTTTGHWEIAGIISEKPMPTYPDGFPTDVIEEFERRTGRKVICNKPYSGTEVIKDYGREHIETGALIVYTSADSVFQIAAHENVVPVEQLYKYCEIAREMLQGQHGVGRVIARPFTGEYPFARTPRRHDYSLVPPKETMLDAIKAEGLAVRGVGKIYDIFAGKGITSTVRTVSNDDGMEKTFEIAKENWNGLCFVNLVDFDMTYGHRNDVEGYTNALNKVDRQLERLCGMLGDNDIVMITADHGCDPITPSTDHSREYTPLLIYGKKIKSGVDLGTRNTFADIGKTVCDILDVPESICGTSFKGEIL